MAFSVAGLATALGLLAQVRPVGRRSVARVLAGTSVAVIGAWTMLAVRSYSDWFGHINPYDLGTVIAANFDESLASAQREVVSLAVVAGLAAIALRLTDRSTEAARPRWLAGPALLLASGIVAFAATRGVAHDARHVFNLRPDHRPLENLVPLALTRCDSAFKGGAAVVVDAEGIRLEGEHLDPPDQLRERLDDLQKRYEVIHQADPAGAGLEVAINPANALPIDRLAAVLAQSSRPGRKVHLAAPKEESLETRTLGALRSSRLACLVDLEFSPDGRPLTDFKTAGEFAAALSEKSFEVRW
ncbi:MAG: hypothetical protein QM765_43660 [Myxococcales bacterium]